MLGIGPMELIMIVVVATIFIGPEKLPDLMRKFGKIFVQVRRQATDVKNTFTDVVHEAERELELERIRELRDKLASSSPTQVLDATLSDQAATENTPLFGPGLDEFGHPLPGYDDNGYPSKKSDSAEEVHPPEAVARDYHEGHYVEGQFVKNSDSFLAWDPEMAKIKHPEPPQETTHAVAKPEAESDQPKQVDAKDSSKPS